MFGQRQVMWPAVQDVDEPICGFREHRFDAALLGAEVAPDRARRKACGRGDVVTTGAGDTALPKQLAGMSRHLETRLFLLLAHRPHLQNLSLSDSSNVSLSDKLVKVGW